KTKARAAVSKAGPRLAEVAGSASLRDALRWNERFDFAGMRSSDQTSFEKNLLSRCGPPLLHQPERRIRRSSRDDDISCNDRLGMDHHPVRNPKESGDRLDPAQFRRIFRKVGNRKHRRGEQAYYIQHKPSRSLPQSSCFYACSRAFSTASTLASSTIGARCCSFRIAASSFLSGNKSPRWNLMVKSGSFSMCPVRMSTTSSLGLTKPCFTSFFSPASVTADAGSQHIPSATISAFALD